MRYDAVRMDERTFQKQVLQLAHSLGWKSAHFHDSRREVRRGGRSFMVGDNDAKGWPDLVLAHERSGRLLVRELKSDTGRLTPEQKAWLATLTACGIDATVWRPRDWSAITAELTPRRTK